MDYKLLINRKVYGAGLALLLVSQSVLGAHFVSVSKPEPMMKVVTISVIAQVLETAANDTDAPSLGRTYHLSIPLPNGVTPNLLIGSKVTVTLPTIHNNNAVASVKSISKSKVELILSNQTQLLGGQRLKSVLPLKPNDLYRIPFQAIYSPRGLTTEVFVVSKDMQVSLVSIVPLEVLPDGKVIVSSNQLNGVSIVVQGNDNLISGDNVQLIDSKKD